MGRCIVDALLTVDPRLGLAAKWRWGGQLMMVPAGDVSSSCEVESIERWRVDTWVRWPAQLWAMGGPVHSLYCTGCWVTLHT